MFEKEVTDLCCSTCNAVICKEKCECWTFAKKAAELVYNQANEWHKVADGDLPKDVRYVWTNVGAGYYDDDGWWDDFGRLQGVIAWCEPKFKE